jgi:hypothetical protein
MVSLYVSGALSDKWDSYTLTLNGENILASYSAPHPGDLSPNQAPYTVFSFETFQPFNQHGTLTLTITITGDLTGPQIFTVNLP